MSCKLRGAINDRLQQLSVSRVLLLPLKMGKCQGERQCVKFRKMKKRQTFVRILHLFILIFFFDANRKNNRAGALLKIAVYFNEAVTYPLAL